MLKLEKTEKAELKRLRADNPDIEFFHGQGFTVAYIECFMTTQEIVRFSTCVRENSSKKWREYYAITKLLNEGSAELPSKEFYNMLDALEY